MFPIFFFRSGYLLDYNRKYLIRDGDLKNTGIVNNEDGTRRSSRSSTVIQVSFEDQRIEISFNEDLDKDFIKDLSLKLYEWTSNRWIITLSKTKGQPSKKEKEVNLKKELIENTKNSSIYINILEKFPDAELFDVKTSKKKDQE